MQEPDWSDLRVALAVARGGGLGAAARALGIDDTTVSRRLRRLEEALGATLFERDGAGALRPTAVGAGLVVRAEAMEREVSALSPGGAARAASGTVRLSTVPILANRLLAPAAAALLDRHPDLRLELSAAPADLSLTRREADMALRLARPRTGGTQVIARRIATLAYAAYGPAQVGTAAQGWLGYDEGFAHLPPARWLTAQKPSVGLAASDAETLLEAAAGGAGRTLLPVLIADRDPRLRRLSPETPVERELWLLIHRDLAPLPRIRAVADWIKATLAAGEEARQSG